MIRSYLLWIGFSLALFLSATMMFVLEPFIAKKLLPDLGGSPNVWNTAVLFFQLILFIGYLYAHLLCTKVKQNQQKFVHLAVLALPLLATSFNLPLSEPTGASPIAWVFISLTSMTGALFSPLPPQHLYYKDGSPRPTLRVQAIPIFSTRSVTLAPSSDYFPIHYG